MPKEMATVQLRKLYNIKRHLQKVENSQLNNIKHVGEAKWQHKMNMYQKMKAVGNLNTIINNNKAH